MLQPLTRNSYTLKDSFGAISKIKLEEGYQILSNVESLFTNVPLNKTINIILKRI